MKRIFSIVYCVLFLAHFANAAEMVVVSSGGEGAVLLRATTPINALGGTIDIPTSIIIREVSKEGSVIPLWIEGPVVKDGQILFSGIIPGGFSGEGIIFRFSGDGDLGALSFNEEETQILLHDGMATEDNVVALPPEEMPEQYQAFPVEEDKIPPSSFTPERAVIPTETGEQEVLVVHTMDHETEIWRYEVAFSNERFSPDSDNLLWKEVTPPIPLPADSVDQYIYIKATDKAGNSRVEILPPAYAQDRGIWKWIFGMIGIGLVSGMIFSVFFRRKRNHDALFQSQVESPKEPLLPK